MKAILTPNGLEKLRKNLAEKKVYLKHLQAEKAHAYTASGDGWHDNPGWIQLGQQEEMLSQEIVKLEHRLSSAIVVNHSNSVNGRIQIGSTIRFSLEDSATKKSFSKKILLVGSGESDLKNQSVSYDSPIGLALMNLNVGDECQVFLPNGVFKLRVEEVING